jgi:hypothetical protein
MIPPDLRLCSPGVSAQPVSPRCSGARSVPTSLGTVQAVRPRACRFRARTGRWRKPQPASPRDRPAARALTRVRASLSSAGLCRLPYHRRFGLGNGNSAERWRFLVFCWGVPADARGGARWFSARKSFVSGSANGNRTPGRPVQPSSVWSKCLQTRSTGIAKRRQKALRNRDVVTWLSLGTPDKGFRRRLTGCTLAVNSSEATPTSGSPMCPAQKGGNSSPRRTPALVAERS